ncbi:MAG: hypothetical protein U0V73_16710 [Acidimicrobiia bacterium]
MRPTKKQVATGVLAVAIPVATGGPAVAAATQQSAAHRAEVSAARAAARTASRPGMRPQARLEQGPGLVCVPYLSLPVANPPKECGFCFANTVGGVTFPFEFPVFLSW